MKDKESPIEMAFTPGELDYIHELKVFIREEIIGTQVNTHLTTGVS